MIIQIALKDPGLHSLFLRVTHQRLCLAGVSPSDASQQAESWAEDLEKTSIQAAIKEGGEGALKVVKALLTSEDKLNRFHLQERRNHHR